MTKAVLNVLCKSSDRHSWVKDKGRAKHNFTGLNNVRVAMALIWLLFIEQSKCVRQYKELTKSMIWILKILYPQKGTQLQNVSISVITCEILIGELI